jgi:hypothetical protein
MKGGELVGFLGIKDAPGKLSVHRDVFRGFSSKIEYTLMAFSEDI